MSIGSCCSDWAAGSLGGGGWGSSARRGNRPFRTVQRPAPLCVSPAVKKLSPELPSLELLPTSSGSFLPVAYPGILCWWGSTNSVEDRENGDLGAVGPWSGVLEAAVIWYKEFHFIQ